MENTYSTFSHFPAFSRPFSSLPKFRLYISRGFKTFSFGIDLLPFVNHYLLPNLCLNDSLAIKPNSDFHLFPPSKRKTSIFRNHLCSYSNSRNMSFSTNFWWQMYPYCRRFFLPFNTFPQFINFLWTGQLACSYSFYVSITWTPRSHFLPYFPHHCPQMVFKIYYPPILNHFHAVYQAHTPIFPLYPRYALPWFKS